MDARTGESLDLDRELAAVLSVEPSVEFLARVRLRIAAEPEPPAWRHWYMVVAAGACATAIAIAAAGTHMNQATLPSSSSKIIADISLLVPAIVPGPLAIAAAGSRREKPTSEMQAIMRSNAKANKAVSAHLAEKDYDAIATEAATYSRNFAYIETFWAAKQIDDAVSFSRSGLRAAADLRAAALAGDDAAIAKAVAAMAAVCGACHIRYREELPDNTYEIRL